MYPEQELELKKIVWAYMIEKGVVTTGDYNYYGGEWYVRPRRASKYPSYDYRDANWWTVQVKENIRDFGVDWEATKIPESSYQNNFEDSFSPSTQVECLLGTLRLKNGIEYVIGVAGAETRFNNYVKALSELMTDKERVKKIFLD